MEQTERRDVPRHPIRVVAERTGLTPDVLRVWQKRYGVVLPGRSERGQRLYSDHEVERLRLLSLAVRAGRSVGQLAQLPDDELAQLVAEDGAARIAPPRNIPRGDVLEEALDAVGRLDAEALDATLRRALVVLDVARFLEEVAAPLLREVGLRWHEGTLTPAHEHMATAVMRRVLDWVRAACGAPVNAPRFLVATLPGEQHEIGAMLAAAAAAAERWNVTYLGANLPPLDIAIAANELSASAVGVSAVYTERPETLWSELHALRAGMPPNAELLVGGAALSRLASLGDFERGIRPLASLADLRTQLSRLHRELNPSTRTRRSR